MYEMNLPIYQKLFATLILDYEFDDRVICRIVVDGVYRAHLSALNRDEAIAKFRNGEWEEK